jgi:hypothetical protein
MKRPLGPNVRKLITLRMSMLAIPPGTPDPFMAGVRAILEAGRLTEFATEAREWVRVAIATLKSAPNNPWGTDDETIAAELLRRVERQQRKET